MQIAHVVAGYSLGEADVLRRAMGKKQPEEMARQRHRFLDGARAKGFPEGRAAKLFELMEQFAGYGFNKSHSAAYGFLAYLTAYLKTNYAVEFMASLLTAELSNADKVRLYLGECRDMGIEVLAPDIATSYWDFTPAGDRQIRFGLGAIKNLGKGAVECVIQAREEREAGFRSLFEFCESIDWTKFNKRMMESAIKAGALDSLGGHRAQLIAAVDAAIEAGQRAARDRETGQAGLFAELELAQDRDGRSLPDVAEWRELETLAKEKETLGFYVTGHPLDAFRKTIEELGTLDSSSLSGLANNTEVALCGILHSIQRRRNREGRAWASAVLEDNQGSVELLIFSTQFEQLKDQLVVDRPVLVRGNVRAEEETGSRISVSDLTTLENARLPQPGRISVTLTLDGEHEAQRVAERLLELFRSNPGETDVRLRLRRPQEFLLTYDIEARVNPDRSFRREVEAICGKGALEVIG